ncbi:hypothetical protein GGR55DRAFT_156915 [Xylaria sp. FL0064]|nr:hypothetical protein GGR55DRAFT_156915 [Xylaria sp. FL0064]
MMYYYAVRLSFGEGKGAFPIWMHLTYMAHDVYRIPLFHNTAPNYDHHWFFYCMSLIYGAFIVLELYCIYRVVSVEDEDISSHQLRKQSRWQSLWHLALFAATIYKLVWLSVVIMGPICFLEWDAFCTGLLTFAPTTTWLCRGSRNGLGVSLALWVVANTVIAFAPFGV